MARVRGEVNADSLPITSDRTGFIKDSGEYQEFLQVMGKVIEGVKVALHKLTLKREGKKVSRALKEALQRIYKALAANPDLSPFGALPIGDEAGGPGNAALVSQKKEGPSEEEVKIKEDQKTPVTKKVTTKKPATKKSVVKKSSKGK